MADFTRSLDKTRPVMAVLSRSYLKDNAAPALDIIGINRYFRFVSNLFQFLIINVLEHGRDLYLQATNYVNYVRFMSFGQGFEC